MSDVQAPKPHFTENPFNVLIFNIALPAIILFKFSRPERLGPMVALGVALIFPLFFGAYDFYLRRKANPISVLGFISILATGSFGLLHLDGHWFAFKEATIPSLMGLAVLYSLRTKSPFVRTMLYNERVIDVPLVDRELAAKGNTEAFNRLLVTTTWIFAGSFLLSAGMNFTLSTMIIKSAAGTPEFNEELGRMTAVSYAAVVGPCFIISMFALWRLLSGIKRMTGLDLETIFKSAPPKAGAAAKSSATAEVSAKPD